MLTNKVSYKSYCTIYLLLFLLSFKAFAQDKSTLSGYIKDAENGETLIGAAVYVKSVNAGVVSNSYGFYSLTVPSGKYEVVFSFIGFKTVKKEIDLTQNQSISIELSPDSRELNEVIVSGEREDINVSSTEMSVQKIDIKTINKIPPLLGEADIIQSIQLLPGVTSVGEGSSGFNVRGGGIDQNLILLDEAPVFNSSHLFGFFSVFNPDAVKDVKLVKGGIPAQYGGRLSSLLDVRMKEGNSKRFSTQGGIGLIFSRLTVEAPIVKDKASFIVAGRRSYIDIVAKPFLNQDLSDAAFNFYDLTAKVNYNIGEKDRIFLSGYFGRDVFNAGELFDSDWGNITGSFRWNHIFNERLFSNLTYFYSDYQLHLGFEQNEDLFDWRSSIKTNNLKLEFNYYLNDKNTMVFGAQSTVYKFSPGDTNIRSGGIDLPGFTQPSLHALENGIFIGNEQSLSDKFSLQYGLRFSTFTYMGEGTAYEFAPAASPGERRNPIPGSAVFYDMWEPIETYYGIEPRFSAKFQYSPRSSIKTSFNYMKQYIHLISNTAASTPFDIWMPTTNNIKPQGAYQVALGYFRNFKENAFETSVEVYYKGLENQLEYIDGANLLLNEYLEGELMSGIGRAYGVELFVKKNSGKLNGWVSYTYARTERKTNSINKDRWYPARFDKPHNMKLVSFYDINDRWTVSANFTFASGTPTTFPSSQLNIQGYNIPYDPFSSRNNQRIPNYHRLDLSVTLNGKKHKRWETYWVFGVYNAYARKNAYSIYFQPSTERPVNGTPVPNEAYQLSVIANAIPSISFNFKY